MENSEQQSKNYYVIKKGSKEQGKSFNSYSNSLLEMLRKGDKGLLTNLCFPMLDQVINYVQLKKGTKIDKVLICATQQAQAHPFDTRFVGTIIKEFYSKVIDEIPYKNLETYYLMIDFGAGQAKLIEDCYDLLKKEKEKGFTEVYISNRAGLPNVTQALNFVGYFQDYTYLSVHSKNGVSEVSHKKQESILSKLVKRKIIEFIDKTDLSK